METLLAKAWLGFLDPGSPPADVEAALCVLRKETAWLNSRLRVDPPNAVIALAPDRMEMLRRLRVDMRGADRLATELLESFAAARLLHVPLGIRRAHAIFRLLHEAGAASRASCEDVLWLVQHDEFASPDLAAPLSDWCEAHDPLPSEIVEAVRALRDEEEDSPILDRLAAWVAPSVRGMNDLAGWYNGRRQVLDDQWRAAAKRWSVGETTHTDEILLNEAADPESSEEVAAIARAMRRSPQATAVALREAHALTPYPVLKKIFGAWIRAFLGGAS